MSHILETEDLLILCLDLVLTAKSIVSDKRILVTKLVTSWETKNISLKSIF